MSILLLIIIIEQFYSFVPSLYFVRHNNNSRVVGVDDGRVVDN